MSQPEGDLSGQEPERPPARVRLRSARPLVDMRPIRELLPLFAPHGFLQIHREHAVNLRRIREIRRRDEGRDWEVSRSRARLGGSCKIFPFY